MYQKILKTPRKRNADYCKINTVNLIINYWYIIPNKISDIINWHNFIHYINSNLFNV